MVSHRRVHFPHQNLVLQPKAKLITQNSLQYSQMYLKIFGFEGNTPSFHQAKRYCHYCHYFMFFMEYIIFVVVTLSVFFHTLPFSKSV